MAKLVWDETGERVYQSGVDHGVLYLHDGTVAVWNGLTGMEESSDSELKSYYLDGVKYLEYLTPGDFQGKLKAVTYPDEFDLVNGNKPPGLDPGILYYNQPARSFNLSYRTKIGDDLDEDRGYKIHILYNVLASWDNIPYNTQGKEVAPIEFSWSLTGIPPRVAGYRPTVHISIDSNDTPSDVLQILEAKLYGTAVSGASLPSLQDIAEYFGYVGALIIVDHGDGTWSAIDEAETYITMLSSTIFEIENADATYLDLDTYTITSTNVE